MKISNHVHKRSTSIVVLKQTVKNLRNTRSSKFRLVDFSFSSEFNQVIEPNISNERFIELLHGVFPEHEEYNRCKDIRKCTSHCISWSNDTWMPSSSFYLDVPRRTKLIRIDGNGRIVFFFLVETSIFDFIDQYEIRIIRICSRSIW